MFGANCEAFIYKEWGATWWGFNWIASSDLSLSETRVFSLSHSLSLTLSLSVCISLSLSLSFADATQLTRLIRMDVIC
jgi:hypothetical protein